MIIFLWTQGNIENMVNDDVTIYSSFDSYIIESFFKENYPYCALFYDSTFKWKFYEDKDTKVIATVSSRKGHVLSINVNAVMEAKNYGDYKGIEYFIIHEIRHIYQNEQIRRYKNKEPIVETESTIKTWINEKKKKLKRYNEDGSDNVDFYMQKKEYDAYAFAYAVMKYKYDTAFDPFIPEVYKKPFLQVVRKWTELFKKEGL